MVADINTDMFLPIVPLKILTVYGLAESDLGDRAKQVGEQQNLQIQSDPLPLLNVFIRSDQYNFVRHGVPSVMIDVGATPGSPEAAIIKTWHTERYHAPSDDANQPVNLATAAAYEEVIRALAIEVANDPKRRQCRVGLPPAGSLLSCAQVQLLRGRNRAGLAGSAAPGGGAETARRDEKEPVK
jgi:Zn-dependent M28 family amino/carboxypeptidase